MKKQNWVKHIFRYICNKIYIMTNYINNLLEHATSQGYKSNVMKPLLGINIIFITGGIISHYFGVPYLPIVLIILSTVGGVCLLFAYFFCLLKNPDLLRSEKYNLEKTAIEKVSITGDSTTKRSIAMPRTDYVVVEGKQTNLIEAINEQ